MTIRMTSLLTALALLFAGPAVGQSIPGGTGTPATLSPTSLDHCGAVRDRVESLIGLPTARGDQPAGCPVLCKDGYIHRFDPETQVPEWVLEYLTPARFVGPGDRKEQGDPFAADPDIPGECKSTSPIPDDYRNTGFDRGHMSAAANNKFTEAAMEKSFFMTNMAPQVGIGFNRGIWANLEEITREWACERGELIVVSGPIYDSRPPELVVKRPKSQPAEEGQVSKPTAFFKVAYDPRRERAVALILPNARIDLKKRTAWDVLRDYTVSIQEVEFRTGLDLFPNLPDGMEQTLESLDGLLWPDRDRCERVLPALERAAAQGG